MKFTPDKYHCPESCLCGICQNENECDEACEEYKQMVAGCHGDSCYCKVKKEVIS